jgi:small subunit ribosomal protein S5
METTKPKQNTNSRDNSRSNDSSNNRRGGGERKSRTFFERPKPEFDQKIVSIRRVTRVVKGGRRMTFAVAMAIGDKKGSVGLGTGKGGDTAIAINKSIRQAKKNMFKIKTTKEMSIPHEISGKFASSKLVMMPNRGKGLVAGSTVRDMLILAGLKNITAKLNSPSKNKLNNARVAYKTLYQLKTKISMPAKGASFVADPTTEDNKDKEVRKAKIKTEGSIAKDDSK